MKNILLLSVLAAVSCGNYASATMEQTPSKTSKLPPKYIIPNQKVSGVSRSVDAPRNLEQRSIFDAIESGDVGAVNQIIDKDKKMVNVLNSPKQRLTPLHFAVMKGNPDIILILLKAGAKVDARDWARRTPINYAKSDEIKRLFATWKELASYEKQSQSFEQERKNLEEQERKYLERRQKMQERRLKSKPAAENLEPQRTLKEKPSPFAKKIGALEEKRTAEEQNFLKLQFADAILSRDMGYVAEHSDLIETPISEETLLRLGQDKLVKVLKLKDSHFGRKERKGFLPIEIAFCLEDINMVNRLDSLINVDDSSALSESGVDLKYPIDSDVNEEEETSYSQFPTIQLRQIQEQEFDSTISDSSEISKKLPISIKENPIINPTTEKDSLAYSPESSQLGGKDTREYKLKFDTDESSPPPPRPEGKPRESKASTLDDISSSSTYTYDYVSEK